MRVKSAVVAVVAVACIGLGAAINNGVGHRPPMGMNTWYALHSHLTYPNYTWEPGFVLADAVVDIAEFMTTKGLYAAGYDRINLDDCVVIGRDAAGDLIPDPQAFPKGVLALAEQLKGIGYDLGFYTDRGNYTCSCWASPNAPKRPGSWGHESQDAAWWVKNGISYIKVDSCNANGQDPVAEYTIIRDALNATGTPVFYSLCWGAGEQVAQVGKSIGNQWRIAEDDGGGWGPILVNVDVDATLGQYSGCTSEGDCGFNDPGLLLVGDPALTEAQSRSHLALWSVLMAKLLISVDPRQMPDWAIDLLTNPAVIAVNQDAATVQGKRIQTTVVTPALDVSDPMPRLPGLSASHTYKYASVPAARSADPRVSRYLEATPASYKVGLSQTEVWARPLSSGAVAVVLFNNNVTSATNISCTASCWTSLGFSASTSVSVLDIWSRAALPDASGTISATVDQDDSAFLLLTPK